MKERKEKARKRKERTVRPYKAPRLSQKVALESSRIKFTKKVLGEVVMEPQQNQPESMPVQESCVV